MSFISMHFPFPAAWATSPAALASSAYLAGADADDAGDAGDVAQEVPRMQNFNRVYVPPPRTLNTAGQYNC